MTTKPGMDDERALKEATQWLIELQEEPDDPALRTQFDAWLAADPANKAAWAETSLAYDLIGPATSDDAMPFRPFAAGTEPSNTVVAYGRHSGRRLPLRRVAFGLAATAIAACLALVFVPNLVLRWQADYATGTGEQRTVSLADGTTVALGPDSAIDIAYVGNARRVRLLSGQAFFEVTHDPSRPFQVEARALEVTDLGTGFDVQLAPDGASVAVAHGAVRVDYAGASPPVSRNLQAGEWMQVAWSGQAVQGGEPADQVAAWRHGRLIANDRPVSKVVDELRPYFNGIIVLTSTALGERRVTGVYDLHDPEAALRALGQAPLGLSVHRISPWLLVVSGGG